MGDVDSQDKNVEKKEEAATGRSVSDTLVHQRTKGSPLGSDFRQERIQGNQNRKVAPK